MKALRSFFRTIFVNPLLYYVMGAEVTFLVFGFFFPAVYELSLLLLWLICAILCIDLLLLYKTKDGMKAKREMLEKFSNGDENPVEIRIENHFPFTIHVRIIDEIPFQFQQRATQFVSVVESGKIKTIQYFLKPVQRGEYEFGALNVFVRSPLQLLCRKFQFSNDQVVPVYPSFMQMRKFELLAISNRLTEAGVKKIRRRGNNAEFDQIKEYVSGDDYRTINWKATARKNHLMVNQYQDEKSQQVYSLIDMGRSMRMPFNGLSLLDYAINSSLVLSNIAILKSDKAGIVTFSNKVQSVLPADRKSGHLSKLLHLLYNQKTGYLETDYERLYIQLKKRISQRSLLLLYTNFESVDALHRQLKYLRKIAKDHLLVVIFFENTELDQVLNKPAVTIQEVYNKAIAEKFLLEKKQLQKELQKYGIKSILTAPEQLSVNTINKYLELKSRGFF